MMSLYGRLRDGSVHATTLAESLRVWELGDDDMRRRIVNRWSLDASEQGGLDEIKTKLSASVDKLGFLALLERLAVLGAAQFPGYTTDAEMMDRVTRHG